MDEPIADEVRGTVDGHIVLSREVAARGLYPAIDVAASLSRVMNQCTTTEHRADASAVRRALNAYESQRELITLGAYQAGANPQVDAMIRHLDRVQAFLGQAPTESSTFSRTLEELGALARLLA